MRIGNGTGETNKVVIADAVQWIYSSGQDVPVNGSVPVWWSSFYFGATIISGSSVGSNGYSLFTNYVLGLAPTDAGARLSFSITRFNSGFQATFAPCEGGRIYGLQSATNLVNPMWTTVSNLTVSQNTNGQGVIMINNASVAQTFYRLAIQLSP